MGYYSEVGLCLNKAAHDNILAELKNQDSSIQSEVQELLNDAEKYQAHSKDNQESTLYRWPWLKWYSEFKEVKFIESFLASLTDDDDSPLQYRFVRIGEEYEDIEVHGSYYENPFEMDLGRGVYINDQHKPIAKHTPEPCE